MSAVQSTDHERLISDLEDLVPGIRSRSGEGEQLRRLPEATFEAILGTGMMRMHVPERFGGLGLNIDALFDVATVLARADTSTAWTATFLAAHNAALARFPLQAQEEVFGDRGYALSAGSFHPLPGTNGVPEGDGLRVTGRWDFCSGVMHSDWVFMDVPVAGENGGPPSRFVCVVPVEDLTVHDVWHMAGMRATGSNDVSLDDVLIPAHRILPTPVFHGSATPGVALHPEFTFLRMPFYRAASIFHAAFVIGSAERALELFHDDVAPTRRRQINTGALIDSPLTHSRYAKAAHQVHIARLLSDSHVRDAIALYDDRGLDQPLEDRARMRLSSVGSISAAAEAIDLVVRISGGSMFKQGNELERIQRDLGVLLNHNTGDEDFHTELAGRVLLGVETEGVLANAYRAL